MRILDKSVRVVFFTVAIVNGVDLPSAQAQSRRSQWVRNCAEAGVTPAQGCRLAVGDRDRRCPGGSVIWNCPGRIACRVRFPAASQSGNYCSREPALEAGSQPVSPGTQAQNDAGQQGANPVEQAPPTQQPRQQNQPPVQPVARQYMQLPMAASGFPKITHLMCARPAFSLVGGSLPVPDALFARCPQAQVLFLDRCNPQNPGTLFACSSVAPFTETVRAEYLQNTQAYRRMYGRGRDPIIMITRAPQ